MLPSEMIILLAIGVDNKNGEKFRNRPMDVTSEYIGYLYDSLVNRGYLKQRGSGSYRLTGTGRQELFNFIRKNRAHSNELFRRLQLLGIKVGKEQQLKIGELEKEAAKPK